MKRRASTGAAILLPLAAGCVLASCNFIVGVGDYVVGDAATDGTPGSSGSGSSGGKGSSGGSSSSGGSGNSGGSSGSGSNSGGSSGSLDGGSEGGSSSGAGDTGGSDTRDGDTGSDTSEVGPDADAGNSAVGDGGEGGGDADGGSAEAETGVTCGQSLTAAQPDAGTDFQRLVSTCVLAVSCDPYVFPVSISDCLTRNELQATGSFACLSTISDCGGYYSCQGVRYATFAECPGFNSLCDPTNNVATDCFIANPGIVKNCRKQGGTCATYTDSSGNSRADCVVVPSCTATDSRTHCSSNNQAFTCASGIGYGFDCTAISATCATPGGATANCYPDGTACSAPGSSSCNGATLTSCTSTGQGFNFDCTRAGGSCSASAAGSAGCVSPGCSLGSTCAESCDGIHTLTACVGGAQYTIDCTQYGFTSCGASSSSGNVYCLP